MKLVLYDMKVLSLVSTVTSANSKAVIEHEIIFMQTKKFWLILMFQVYQNKFSCFSRPRLESL